MVEETMLASNKRLMYHAAKRYPNMPLDDKMQALSVGILRAHRLYDPSKGSWLAVATRAMHTELSEAARLAYWSIVPSTSANRAVRQAMWFCWLSGCPLEAKIVAAFGRMTLQSAKDVLHVMWDSSSSSRSRRSLAYQLEHAGGTDGRFSQVEDRLDLELAMRRLTPRQAAYTKAYYLTPQKVNMRQVGARFGRTVQCVQRTLDRAKTMLKDTYGVSV